MKSTKSLFFNSVFVVIILSQACNADEKENNLENVYPWCIVAFDSLERSPGERVEMMKELGFSKYAYDWRDEHLNETDQEIKLAGENGIEIISVWLWLNAKRDSLGKLSPSNEKIFQIVKNNQLKLKFWLSFSPNFFENRSHEESMQIAVDMIRFINEKAQKMDCEIALYNHRGWFGNPYNQIEIIESLPGENLTMVFNFHHAHEYRADFSQIAPKIAPYLSAVNLNGMNGGETKILPLAKGKYEKEMIELLTDEGYKGPWGLLGHVENADVKKVLEKNIEGFHILEINHKK